MTERTGERATGTPNTIYDLSSVLFHALEGGASYDTYIEDAEQEGDRELADFFRRVRDEDSMRADEAQRLLAERTPTAARTEGNAMPTAEGAGGVSPRTEPTGVAPGTEPGTEEPIARAEEAPAPRTAGMEEGASPRMEERPLGAEERPLGTEGTMPPRPEEAPPEGAPPPRTEGVSPRAEEAPLPEEEERARQAERGEDKGPIDRAVDRARDALRGDEPERR